MTKRPGGIRTFPMLAFAGGILYLFDPAHLVPFTGGLIMLGAWLAIFYRRHVGKRTKKASRMSGWSCPCSTFTPIFSAPSLWRCRPGWR
jgi:hypothetical protein